MSRILGYPKGNSPDQWPRTWRRPRRDSADSEHGRCSCHLQRCCSSWCHVDSTHMSVSCGDATACYGCRKVRGAEREEDVKEVERTEGLKVNVSQSRLPLAPLRILTDNDCRRLLSSP